jgi:hypothetical protein
VGILVGDVMKAKRKELTVRVEEPVAKKLRRYAKREKRSISNYLEVSGIERGERKEIEQKELA